MDDKKLQKVLVTGGAGFIGSHIVDQLLSRSIEVVVLDIKPKEEADNLHHCLNQITYCEGDIRNYKDVTNAVSDCNGIVHLAAIVSVPYSLEAPLETHATNVDGTLNVFQAAKEAGIKRVVYASSAAVYGDTQMVPTPETAPLSPLSPYGLHKQINEQYGRLYNECFNLQSVGLRFFNVYGPRQDPSSPYSGVISIFSDKMKQDIAPTIYGDGTASRDFVYVGDVAKVCVAFLLESNETGVYNVGTGSQQTINDLVAALNKVQNSNLQPSYAKVRPGDILHSCSDVACLKEALGWAPVTSLKAGLESIRINQ